MNFHILTLFPDMIQEGLNKSIIGRAAAQGTISIKAHDIREYTTDKHKKADDYPYGGGAGMLMQAQPVYDCFLEVNKTIQKSGKNKPRVIYVTPQGKTFHQTMAQEFAKEDNLVFLCGHYEGIDERVLEEIVTDYVSIGDYVLTGGELPAMVMIDAIARLVTGVLSNEESARTESFRNHLLEYPQYSRPEEWNGKKVPEVLLSGNHKKIEEWRLEQSVLRTKERRPDLYEKYERLKECEARLMKNKLFHMDMLEPLRRGSADLLYFGRDGVLLKEQKSGAYMMTVTDKESGERMLSYVKEKPALFVSHQEFMNDLLCSRFSMRIENECIQAVYTRKEPLPMKKDADIRRLGESFFPVIKENYATFVDEEYIRERLKSGVMYGIFEQDVLAGFIGMHQEGSIGMLEVLEPYRLKGYGRQLEAFYINLHLKQDYTPFGQVISGNTGSVKLQEKLNLYTTKEKLYWLSADN